ncbi:ENR1 protein, partial [Chloroceryle aenea]|nr:ENR1 protein [Chloroceryle aenea]
QVGSLYLCIETGSNPFKGIREISPYWDMPENDSIEWIAPDGLFWICGRRRYSLLPKEWRGTCTIGLLHQGFFLLPKSGYNGLGIPL